MISVPVHFATVGSVGFIGILLLVYVCIRKIAKIKSIQYIIICFAWNCLEVKTTLDPFQLLGIHLVIMLALVVYIQVKALPGSVVKVEYADIKDWNSATLYFKDLNYFPYTNPTYIPCFEIHLSSLIHPSQSGDEWSFQVGIEFLMLENLLIFAILRSISEKICKLI